MRQIIFIALLSLLCGCFAGADEAEIAGAKKVLILNSYSYDHEWTRSINDEIYSMLSAYPQVKLINEFMDTKRHTDKAYYKFLYELYKSKYHDMDFDAIVTSDDNAVNFALEYRKELFPDTPIVFCGVNSTTLSARKDFANISGSLEVLGIAETIDVMLQLIPYLDTLYVVNESETLSPESRDAFNNIFSRYSENLSFRWFEDRSPEELQAVLSTLPDNAAVLLLSFFNSGDNRFFTVKEGAEFVCESSAVPVFTMWDYFLGSGVMGGMMTSGKYQGRAAAEILIKVLSGISPDEIPVASRGSNNYMFDREQLTRFDISSAALPDECMVINKSSSLLMKYRSWLFVAVVVIVVLLVVCIFLIINIRARRKAEKALHESEDRLIAAFDSAKDSIAFWDRNYKFIYANRVFLEDFGLPYEKVVGHDLRDLLQDYPEFLAVWMERIDNVFVKSEILRVQDEIKLAKGIHHFETILTPVKDETNGVKSVCLVSRDVTGRVVSENQQKELEQQLQYSEKMKSIGYLAGGIAHDFNNILGGIIGAAELIQVKVVNNPEVIMFCDIIISSAEKAADLTGKLLAFARKHKTRNQRVEINSMVEDTIEILKHTVYKTISIDYSPFINQIWITGDSSQLQNVLINLGINSEHAMDDAGKISIKVEKVGLSQEECEAIGFDLVAGDYGVIEFKDT